MIQDIDTDLLSASYWKEGIASQGEPRTRFQKNEGVYHSCDGHGHIPVRVSLF